MNQEVYAHIKNWFNNYTNQFEQTSEEIQLNLEIKRNHSFNTAEIVSDLAKSIELDESEILIAQTAALLHDLGRFDQLVQYETFADTEQVNHVALGIELIEKENLLVNFSEETREIIIDCVRYHNQNDLPKSVNKDSIPFINLVKDADRIDALNIVSKYYAECKVGSNPRLELELADKAEISKKIFKSIMDEKPVSRKDILTLNELKLYQMAWIYDFKHKKTYKIVSEKGYLKKIFDSLPKKDEVIDMYRQMKIYLENSL